MTQSEITSVATAAKRWKVKRNASTVSDGGYRSYRCQAVGNKAEASTVWVHKKLLKL